MESLYQVGIKVGTHGITEHSISPVVVRFESHQLNSANKGMDTLNKNLRNE